MYVTEGESVCCWVAPKVNDGRNFSFDLDTDDLEISGFRTWMARPRLFFRVLAMQSSRETERTLGLSWAAPTAARIRMRSQGAQRCCFFMIALLMVCALDDEFSSALPAPALFVSQRVDRVELGGLAGRIKPKENPHGSGEQEGEQDRAHGNNGRDLREDLDLAHELRSAVAESDADDPAEEAQNDGLGQELE